MTLTTLDTTTIEHLDFKEERACDQVRCYSGHPPATHMIIPRMHCNCNVVKLACPDCTQRWLALLNFPAGDCIKCREPQPGLYRDLIEIRPL